MSDSTIGGGFRPATSEGTRAFVLTPFSRMARTHGVAAMADAMVAASLAGSLFFSAPGGEARGPVFRYLVITMLPFALLSPLIGPAIDRMHGGHRLMVIASNVLRAVACWFMATTVNDGDFVFFLYALLLLVFQKAYSVARSALVPTLVRSDAELVEANSKLALVSGVASVVGVIPAGILIKLFGAQWSLRLAMIVYVIGAVMATRISALRVANKAPDPTERIELRGATILMAGSAMGLIRGAVGFLMFLIAFSLSDGGKPTMAMALVGGSLAAFQQVGNLIAPKIREHTSEENLLTGVLALIVASGVASLLLGEVAGGMLIGGAVGFAAATGKLAFDSILQRDAPDANRGRAFAKFETRFQITWVFGAAIPVGIHMSATTGYVVVFLTAVFALAGYALARLSYAHKTGASDTIATARAAALDDRIGEMSTEVKGRLAAMPRAAFRKLRTARYSGGGDDEYGYYDDDGEYDDYSEQGEAYDDQYEDGYDEDWDPEEDWDHAEADTALPLDSPTNPPADEFHDPSLASHSPVAWVPDDDGDYGYEQWQPVDTEIGHDYLEDVDPDVNNPFPWSPDDPTRPD